MGTAAYKTVELDDFFDQAAIHRETQGHESLQFTKLFKEITYLRGRGSGLPPRRRRDPDQEVKEDEAHGASGRGAALHA